MKTILFILTIPLLAACAPTRVRVEIEHLSHATQHFGPNPTNYGVDVAQVVGRWDRGGAYLELGEGLVLEPCTKTVCGSLAGPREVFTGRVGYEWSIHHD